MSKHRATSGTDPQWTTRALLHWTADYLQRRDVDSPRLAADMLLAHVLRVPRLQLYLDPDRPASPAERAAFRELVERAAQHHPVQYLVGQAPFFSLTLDVDPRVLIPRPSTETLVEHVIQHARHTPGFAQPTILDIGTGSGAVALALVKNIPDAHVIAVDISPDALEVARHNARKSGITERLEFRQGSLFDPVPGMRFHFVLSNPPYISDPEWEQVEPNVKNYEPALALRGGADGLDVIRPLVSRAPEYLLHPGQLVVEIAASQKQATLDLVAGTPGLKNARVLADHEGLPRVLVAERG